jgi:hypothetical protein
MGEHLLIGRVAKGDRVPAVWLTPSRLNPEVTPTLVVHPNGIASVSSSALVKTLLSRGGIVMSIDAFQTEAPWLRETLQPERSPLTIRRTTPIACRTS